MRDQFPGFAKIDSAVDILIQVGYITLVGVIVLWGCKGIFTLLLPESRLDQGDDLKYGGRLMGILMGVLIAVFAFQVVRGNQDADVTRTVYVMAGVGAVTFVGFVMWMIAMAIGKED